MTAVLFTCAGRRVDIVSAFARAGATTVAVDTSPLAATLYHADHHRLVPRIDDPGYVPALAEIVAELDVRLVVPLTDLDQVLLARRRDELGAFVLLPSADVVERVNDKYHAHEFFEANGIHSPASWLPDVLPDDLDFPVLVKARQGFGAVGAPGDDLGYQRIVKWWHHVAGKEVRIDANAGTAGRQVAGDGPGLRLEFLAGVFGIDATLDGVAAELHLILRQPERLTVGNTKLLFDQIKAGDGFRHRVLHLDALVDLQKIMVVLHIDQELKGAGAGVVDRLRPAHGGGPDCLPCLFR